MALRNQPPTRRLSKQKYAPVHCPIVVIGASAGGLEVFQQFFDRMPPDSGMAFVLIQHLDPNHETLMPELLGKHTAMKVLRVEDGLKIKGNHVYVMAPSVTIGFSGCVLRVAPAHPTGDRKLIDSCFRSLAEDQRENVVGIVLSGSGADGSAGLQAIKAHGGLTMAQTPDTAKFDSMPRSAIMTGCVDFTLPVAEMPARIIEYVRHLEALHHRKGAATIQKEAIKALPKIFPILRKKTGHDFSRYKQSTLARRIQRRMQVNYADSVKEYVRSLRKNPKEADALFKDLLIGVTQFFRDPENFQTLAKTIVPALFNGKGAKDQVRVWVPGCASGEEAYSIAMLLAEHAGRLKHKPRIQVFATDLDGDALEVARKGRYPDEVAGQVSPERLKRFFKKTGAFYEVVDEVRELCVFSPHNLIKDPPFSRLDLLSCRNVLIYLEADAQKKLLPLFHYALNPSGYLFLGPSENIASRSEFFRPIDPKHRIFQRKPTLLHSPVRVPVLDSGKVTRLQAAATPALTVPKEQGLARSIERLIIEEYAPASVIINADGDVVYFSGNTGKYLEPPAGVPNNKIVAMARKTLRLELRTAVHRAVTTGKEAVRQNIRIKAGRNTQQIDLLVRPLTELGTDPELYIVIFRELAASKTSGRPAMGDFASHEHPIIKQLENELRTTKDDLQTTIEELETSNEELKSANEELLSMNEELQSANEELQTSKEEVQSANEELNRKIEEAETAAAELRRAHEDRSRLASIVQNSQDAIIGKTLEGIITSWNKAAERIFGFSAEEMVGQSIIKIIPPERHDEEVQILGRLRRGEPVEHYETERVRKDGRRILISLTSSPIRDADGLVIGASKIARDITERKQADEARFRLAAVVESSDDAIISKTLDGIITSWNKGAEQTFGYTAEEMVGKHITTLFPPDRYDEEAYVIAQIRRGDSIEHFETVRKTKAGQLIDISLTISPIKDPLGRIVGASKIAREITEQKRMRETVRQTTERLQLALAAGELGDWSWEAATDLVTLSDRASDIFGLPRKTPITWTRMRELLHEEDRERARLAVESALSDHSYYDIEYRATRPSGPKCWIAARGRGVYAEGGAVRGMIGVVQDITERKRIEGKLQDERQVLETLNETGKAIASQLDLQSLVQQVTDAATKLSGAKFGAFFYNVINPEGEALLLYTLSGAPREAFERFGLPRNTPMFEHTFRGKGVVRCNDVLQDPRYGKMPPHHGMPKGHLPVRSYLATPVISRSGEVIGGLFFGHPEPGVFDDTCEQIVVGVAAQAAVAIDNARLYELAQGEIKQRKQAEEKLQEVNQELERRVEQRTAALRETTDQLETFCYTVAHDLRSPLRAQQSFAQVLLEEAGATLNETHRDYAQRILSSARRLDSLVNDLLLYARVGRNEIRFERIELAKVVRDVLDNLAPQIERDEATITTGTLHAVVGHEPALNLAVANLVANALKFVAEGQLPDVHIFSEQKGSTIRLWVEDKGIGIGRENLTKIFGIFQRLHPPEQYSGTGIGLALVLKAVERMGGKVGVESEIEKGSRFWIDLPAPVH